MPIPVTPRFKRLLETANPEQKKALETSSVQSDSDSRDYREEKFKSMPRAMKRIDAGYQDTTGMTPAEKEKYAFENTLSDFRARFRNDEQATHVLDLLEKQYYNSMLTPDKKPYSYYYDNPEDTSRVGVIQPVAQPAPDPFDKEANAAESLMGLSDILPDAVYQVTGSDLAAFASGFLSPSQWLKKGAKGVSNIMDSTTFKQLEVPKENRRSFQDAFESQIIKKDYSSIKDLDYRAGEILRALGAPSSAKTLVDKDGDTILAALSYFQKPDSIHILDVGSLGNKRGGILMSQVEALAKKEGKKITLDAVESAIPYYEKRGYKIIGERAPGWGSMMEFTPK